MLIFLYRVGVKVQGHPNDVLNKRYCTSVVLYYLSNSFHPIVDIKLKQPKEKCLERFQTKDCVISKMVYYLKQVNKKPSNMKLVRDCSYL